MQRDAMQCRTTVYNRHESLYTQKKSPPIPVLAPVPAKVDDAAWTCACAQSPRNLKRMFRMS